MRRTVEERARLYGWSTQEVAAHDEHVKAEVATWPELGEGQKAVIRTLMGSRRIPPRPPAPVLPDRMPPRPEPRKPACRATALEAA
jgi:hypothetical protein